MAGFVSFSGVAGAGSCATQFAANSFPASSGIVTKDLLLPAAAAAKVGVVHCSLNRTYSCLQRFVSSEVTGRGDKMSLSVPEGTKITRGFLPVANRNNHITRSSTNPSAVTFDKEFARLFEEIPLKMNCVALVGQEDILEDIADSATRTLGVVKWLIPGLVAMISDRRLVEFFPRATVFSENNDQGVNLVDCIRRSGLDMATAVEMVREESSQGYVLGVSLVSAIVKLREPAAFIAKEGTLPPPYAGAVPLSAEADKIAYFKGLASEFRQIAAILELALVNKTEA